MNSAMNLVYKSKEKSELTNAIVYTSSLVVVGVFFWLPILTAYLCTRLRTTKKRAYAIAVALLFTALPVKTLNLFRNSFIWEHMIRYFSVKVLGSRYSAKSSVYGIAPHGIIPFSLGLSAFHDMSTIFNKARIAVATATRVYTAPLCLIS